MTGAPGAANEPPQLEQKTASSRLLYPHDGHRFTNLHSSFPISFPQLAHFTIRISKRVCDS
jgi:hypothetical protein